MSGPARGDKDETTEQLLPRLLSALSEAQAYAVANELDEGTIIVRAVKNGVSLARARFPLSTAAAAASRGLAQWRGDGRARRLLLTDAAGAYLSRLAAVGEPVLDPFRAQHGDVEKRACDKGAAPALVNAAESPLAWLARRKDADGKPFLDAAQIEAGERLRRDLEQAQILQRVTANWEASIASAPRGGEAGVSIPEIVLDARRRVARACDAVGPEFAGLLTDVCGYLKGLEIVESERGWPARSGKVVLKMGLARLARHYGVAVQAVGPARSKAFRHWGDDDYRPNM